MDNKENLLEFLKSQRLIVLASGSETPWVSNIFYGIDNNFKIYFISGEETKHGQQILENSRIAFSIAWFNVKNHEDRKAVQGTGICRIADGDEEINKGVELHNLHFPEFAEQITVDWIKNDKNKFHVWVVEPDYMKYWNDELYGDEETEEFSF